MKYRIVSGTSLAVAAIALAMNGASVTNASAKKASVECMGINACKGKSACKTANNACKGQNSCKGISVGQVGGGLREEGRHGRLIDYQAGGRLYRTDASRLGCLLGFAAG